MITLCGITCSAGSIKEKMQILCICILLDAVYIVPMVL
jgi:hypothetical protein